MKLNFTLSVLFISVISYAQNTCETAITITPGTYTTETIDGINYDEGCWNNTSMEGEHAEWYVYAPSADGIARINTNLPTNDGITLSNSIQVSVYEGSCNALDCYAAYGPIGSSAPFKPNFTFEARTGKTYYIAFDDETSNKGLQFELSLQTPTCNTTLPYTEKWNTHLGFTCWETFNTDENQKWVYYNVTNLNEDPATDPVAAAFPSTNTTQPKNDWLVSPAIALQNGINYTISIKYNALDSGIGLANETLRALILDNPDPTAPQLTQLGEITGITMQGGHVEPYNMDLATTVNYNYTPDEDGNFYVALHAASPAATGVLIIYEVKITAGTLSSPEFIKDDVSIYPNPVKNKLFINPASGNNIESVSVIDSNGRTIIEQKDTIEVEVSDLAKGIYIVKIVSVDSTIIKKIIKS